MIKTFKTTTKMAQRIAEEYGLDWLTEVKKEVIGQGFVGNTLITYKFCGFCQTKRGLKYTEVETDTLVVDKY